MSKLKVNSITNRSEDGAVFLNRGATIPSGYQLTLDGGVNSTGILTAANISLSGNVNITGVITSQSYVGDGANLTGVPVVNQSQVFAIKRIITFDEFSKA